MSDLPKTLTLPGSKSITNRDLLIAALVGYPMHFTGVLESDDSQYMIKSLQALGTSIEKISSGVYIVGNGEKNTFLGSKKLHLNVGQSGTCMRFLVAYAALFESETVIEGEEVLMQRPLKPLIQALESMGVTITYQKGYTAPITIKGPIKAQNNTITIDGSISSQFITALMQIGAFIPGGLKIDVQGDLVSKPYIDMTIWELRKFGIHVQNHDYRSFKIPKYQPPENNKTKDITIEGDASALSYIANYAVLHGGTVTINNLGNTSRQGDYKYLEILENTFGLNCAGTTGEVTVLSSVSPINSLIESDNNQEYNFESMPDVSMSFMVLAMFLSGKTNITGLQTLNAKECKRLTVMHQEIEKLGVAVESDENSITIGEYSASKHIGEIKIETHNDHRIAMSFGVLKTYFSSRYQKEIKILNPECVNKTYPNFWRDLEFLK